MVDFPTTAARLGQRLLEMASWRKPHPYGGSDAGLEPRPYGGFKLDRLDAPLFCAAQRGGMVGRRTCGTTTGLWSSRLRSQRPVVAKTLQATVRRYSSQGWLRRPIRAHAGALLRRVDLLNGNCAQKASRRGGIQNRSPIDASQTAVKPSQRARTPVRAVALVHGSGPVVAKTSEK